MQGTETLAEVQKASPGTEPYPSLTFAGEAWDSFSTTMRQYIGCTFGAFPRSQRWADAYFGGSMGPFDVTVDEVVLVENTVGGFPEWGIVYRRWSDDGEEPAKDAPQERAPFSAFATLYLY